MGSAACRHGCVAAVSLVAGVVVLAVWAALAPAVALAQTFSYTGGEQTFVVPAGVSAVQVIVVGAPGGTDGGLGPSDPGGLGGVVSADVPIPLGKSVLYVEVGGIGVDTAGSGRGGFNGGGAYSGGGASDVRLLPRSQVGSINSRIVVAGGGGGGTPSEAGGNAGAAAGGAKGGKAGTATAGGAGGTGVLNGGGPGDDGGSGSLGQGGTGNALVNQGPYVYGAGGGGGYYGGGGGGGFCGTNYCIPSGGGGGGSSYVSPQAKSASFGLDGTRTPRVVITPVVTGQPPTLSGLQISPVKFDLNGRRVAGRCVARARHNSNHPSCRRKIALKISYVLSQAATVTFTVKGSTEGRISHGKCRLATRANHGRRCTRAVSPPGALSQTGTPGENTLAFNGRIGGRRLGAGSYRITATPTDSFGAGTPQTVSFRITA